MNGLRVAGREGLTADERAKKEPAESEVTEGGGIGGRPGLLASASLPPWPFSSSLFYSISSRLNFAPK